MMGFDPKAVAHAYGEVAAAYAATFGDDLSTNDFDRSVIEDVIADLPTGSSIVDLGCGPAQIAAFVEAFGHNAFGVDLTIEMLLVAKQRLASKNLVRGDVCALPIASSSIDVAVCWFSLHNLPRSVMPTALSELARIMRPRGRLLVATHGGTGEEWHATERDSRTEQVVVTYYAEGELVELVRSAGFTAPALRTRAPMPHEHQVRKLFVSARAT